MKYETTVLLLHIQYTRNNYCGSIANEKGGFTASDLRTFLGFTVRGLRTLRLRPSANVGGVAGVCAFSIMAAISNGAIPSSSGLDTAAGGYRNLNAK